MNKKLMFSILLASMLASCAGDRTAEQEPANKQNSQSDRTIVDFDAYQKRSTTRSGLGGVLDVTGLKKPQNEGGGFGVFAYYTDLKYYDQTYVPNFMYNQGVFWNSTSLYWEYNPIMYWPNEYGYSAASDDEDHLTFFAYAPFVESKSPAAGTVDDATSGIVGFTRNTATGDPMVKYIVDFDPSKSVDLCWGVVPSDKTTWSIIQNGSTQTLTEGLPWLNIQRPMEAKSQTESNPSRVKFQFNHALAQLNVQIDTDADVTTHYDGEDPDALDAAAKVYVRSISFTGIALQGALNLNNSTANQAHWLDYSCTTDLAFGQKVTIHDGRRDGREGVQGAEAANELPQGLNPNIVQNSTMTDGVTSTFQNLFKPVSADPAAALEDAVCVIPTGEDMTITIVYDIEIANPDLASMTSDGTTHGMSIQNTVTKTVTFGSGANITSALQCNKRYVLKLHLGMNSVKFDSEVEDWADNTVPGEGWLPSNTRPIVLNHSVMYLGAAQTLTATTDPLGQAVTWDNTDGSIASFSGTTPYPAPSRRASQHIDGSYAYPSVTMTPVAIGTTTVKASLATGDYATCEVHVVPVTITSRHTATPNKTTGPGDNIKDTLLTTYVTELTPYCFGAPSIPPVNWTLTSGTGVVSISTNATTGVCTVTAVAPGTAVITCTNTGYTSAPATCTIEVQQKTPTVTAPTKAANWTYDAAAHDLFATAGSVTGGTMSYSIDGTNWYTNYQDAAVKATNAGSYTLYYKVTGAAGYADIPSTPIGTVVVAKATPTLTLSPTSGNVLVGNTSDFTVTSNPSGGTLSVSVSPAGMISASISGTIVTLTGVSASSSMGDVTVTVTSAATANYEQCTATYTATSLNMSLNKSTTTIMADGTETLSALFAPSGFSESVTWSSNNTSAATVDASGNVTAVDAGLGTATITATSASGLVATCVVTVNPKPLSAATTSDIGKVVASNGYIYKNASIALGASTIAQAMIAYVNSGTTTNNAYPTVAHGLAFALEDVDPTQSGLSTGLTRVNTWSSSHNVAGGTWRLPSAWDWAATIESCGGGQNNSNGTGAVVSLPTPSTNSITIGTSTGQFPGNTYYHPGNLRSMIVSAGGNDFDAATYWTSTLSTTEATNAWRYSFYNSWNTFASQDKTANNSTRAVLAF